MKFCKLGVLAVVTALVLFAQSDTAVLFGLVKDPSGASIARAKVQLRNQATGAIRELNTDERGLFYFTLLPPGSYEFMVEASGFKQYRDSKVQVQVAQVGRFDVQMEIGSTTEWVDVPAEVSTLNTETTAQGTVITSEKLPSLPLNGRQFLQLVLLVPGANPGGRAVQQNVLRQGQIGGLSIAGGRTNNTQFLLDGAINIDPDYSSLNYSPSVDSIAEFQVQTASVGAQYARAAVNVVTRSGSNDLHGGAWEFLRNKALDARPFNLAGDLPQFQRNQFGANLGGPIAKSRLFTFLSYEGLRVHQAGAGLTTVAVPTALERQGDFSRSSVTLKDPATGKAFDNNQIPLDRINPQSLAGMLPLPLPRDPNGNTYVNANELLKQDNNNYSGRIDFTATSKWNLFGRYSLSNEKAGIPFTLPSRAAVNNGEAQNAVIGSTYTFRSNLLNETRIGFNRLRLVAGLPEPSFTVDAVESKLPQFNVGGYPLFGGAGGFNTTNAGGGVALSRNNTYQIYDNVSWTSGRNAVRFGGEVDHVQFNRFEAVNALGSFQFTGRFTGNPLADFLLAVPAVANRSIGPSRIDAREWQYSLYVQDDIRLNSRVTLNLGVRYELAPPFYDVRDQLGSIDYGKVPSPQSIFAEKKLAFYQPTFFVCGQTGYPRGCAHTDKNNIAPRVGVVWSVTPKTVIHAGGGVFYANSDANGLFRLAAGLPTNIAQAFNINTFNPKLQGYDIFGPAVVGPAQIQAAGIDLNQRTSYTLQWNFSVQREIRPNVVLEIGYLATAGLKLEQNVQPNNAQPGSGAVDPRRPYAALTYADGTQFPPYLTVQGNTVPVGFINFLPHSAQSNYHSGFLRFEKRFGGGLSFLSAYTWSKAITNAPQFRNAGGVTGSENSPPQDSYNLAAERGLASFHTSHRWVSTFLYDLPFGRQGHWLKQGWSSKVLGGYQISGIYTMQTGFPFTANLRGDSAGVGAGTGGIFVRPNAVPGQSADLTGSQRTTERWFNKDAFLAPPAATFGNVGRNTVIGPGLTNLDVVFAKNIALVERMKLQLRAEFFNTLNHPNYNIVGRILNDPLFAKVQSQFDPRQLQFGMKLVF